MDRTQLKKQPKTQVARQPMHDSENVSLQFSESFQAVLTNRQSFRVILGCMFPAIFALGCQSEVPVAPPSGQSIAAKAKSVDLTTPEAPFELESDFVPLSLDQFENFGAEPGTWNETAGVMTCTGKPRGYLYSKLPYQNFTLRLEYRFPRPDNLKDDAKFKGNTGFLVYITGEHKLWPICLEVQGKHVQMAAIKENGGAQPVMGEDDEDARQRARKPVGQWNAIEILSKAGALQVSLNGVPISKSQPDFLSEGSIGIQAEDHPFEVRRLRIRTE